VFLKIKVKTKKSKVNLNTIAFRTFSFAVGQMTCNQKEQDQYVLMA